MGNGYRAFFLVPSVSHLVGVAEGQLQRLARTEHTASVRMNVPSCLWLEMGREGRLQVVAPGRMFSWAYLWSLKW